MADRTEDDQVTEILMEVELRRQQKEKDREEEHRSGLHGGGW